MSIDSAAVNRSKIVKLKLLPMHSYVGVNRDDPIRFYSWPLLGTAYRRRVELCLSELKGGHRILEIGFGSGVTFLNLAEMYDEIHGLDLTSSGQEIALVFEKLNIKTLLKKGSVLSMPYSDEFFDAVLSISILEHLKPDEQVRAFREIHRVLKPGGQVVYGVPVERPLMVFMFRLLGYNIRELHFSTEEDVAQAARQFLRQIRITSMKGLYGLLGPIYQVGNFVKGEG